MANSTCYNCQEKGHTSRECTNSPKYIEFSDRGRGRGRGGSKYTRGRGRDFNNNNNRAPYNNGNDV